jgi:uncharacterized protein YutE (UPF0331/DUF86 family)
MTLDNLLRIGKLKAHAAKRVELDRLLSSADRALADARHEALSSVSRFATAYRAIIQASMAAMLANGYRPSTSEPGHHQTLIQALTITAGIPPERVRVLDALRMARNRLEYSGDPVSDAVAEEAVQEATTLLAEVRRSIK